MATIKLHDKEFIPYIAEKEIDNAVEKVANELNKRFINNEEPPIFVCVLSGAFIFAAAVLKKINFNAEITFTDVSSYSGISQCKEVVCNLDINLDIKDKEVIIIDEIIDSGRTAAYLQQKYLNNGAKSVDIATLIYKTVNLKRDVQVDYWGIKMTDDKFIVGCGLDYNEKGRLLKDIYILKD